MSNRKDEDMDWDFGGEEGPRQGPPPLPGKRGLKVVKVSGPQGGPPQQFLPGVHSPQSPFRPQRGSLFGKKGEGATAGSALIGYQAPEREDEAPTRPQYLSGGPNDQTQGDDTAVEWNVTIPGGDTYRVQPPPGSSVQSVRNDFSGWWRENGGGQPLDPTKLHIVPASGVSKEALARIREAINARIKEIVRKKAGGGGYNLYSPNKGKKKSPKPVGSFPTRLAAKEAELARFPPKDPEQLKRARKKLDKLKKDPKKRIEREKEEISGRKKPKKSGAPARDRKKVKEAIIQGITDQLVERLFSDEELPGSPWDERINTMHPDALASDRKLHALHKNIERASIGALGDAHKGLARALRGMAKVMPGDHAFDPERKKMFMPVHLDADGIEIGPLHLYVDGGHVKVEISRDARDQISSLEPDQARDLRGGLMSFQEDHLPEIDVARKAWSDRDEYLDKLHGKLEKQLGGMTGVEHHLAKSLIQKRKPGK